MMVYVCPDCGEPVTGDYALHPDCCIHNGGIDPAMDALEPDREARDRGVCIGCGANVHLEHDEDRVYWEAD